MELMNRAARRAKEKLAKKAAKSMKSIEKHNYGLMNIAVTNDQAYEKLIWTIEQINSSRKEQGKYVKKLN